MTITWEGTVEEVQEVLRQVAPAVNGTNVRLTVDTDTSTANTNGAHSSGSSNGDGKVRYVTINGTRPVKTGEVIYGNGTFFADRLAEPGPQTQQEIEKAEREWIELRNNLRRNRGLPIEDEED